MWTYLLEATLHPATPMVCRTLEHPTSEANGLWCSWVAPARPEGRGLSEAVSCSTVGCHLATVQHTARWEFSPQRGLVCLQLGTSTVCCLSGLSV